MFEKCASPTLRFILSWKASHHKLVENSGMSAHLWPLKGAVPWASWNTQQSLRVCLEMHIIGLPSDSLGTSYFILKNIFFKVFFLCVWQYFLWGVSLLLWWNSSRKVISEWAPNLSANLNELIQFAYPPPLVPSKPSVFCHTVQIRDDEVSD